jgi:hypothetical protein
MNYLISQAVTRTRRPNPRARKSLAVLASLGCAVLSCTVLTSLACRKERTSTFEVRDGVRYVHNLRPASEKPVAGLAFVRKTGELEAKDPDYQFARPMSVADDGRGNIFVLDDKDGCIKKFGPDRKFLLRFGRKGHGPGEMVYPMIVAVAANGQVVVSTMSSDFHVFDNDGVYIDRFRLPPYRGISPAVLGSDRVVAYAFQANGVNSRDNHVLAVFDFHGRVLHEFGDPYLLDTARRTWNANFLSLAVDGDENIFVAFSSLNRIEKYSPAGTLILSVDRALPFEIAHRYGKSSMDIGGRVVSVDEPDFTPVNRGIGVDGRGRIWVLSVRKVFSRSQMPRDYNIRDYLVFEIYSQEGVLLSRIPFPQEVGKFDNMTMRGDHIFFVDPFDQACVYEYAVVDQND